MEERLVTIGVPFFNPGVFFKPAIESILGQTYNNFELILIDDGSTDSALEIATAFNDSRIKVISDGHNLGLPARLNQIVELAKGEFVARMDADDLIQPNRIEKQVRFLEKNVDIDIVSTGICTIDNQNKVVAYRMPSNKSTQNCTLVDGVFGKTGIAHATIVARKSWCLRNNYDENARLMEDYQLWIDSLIKNDLKVGFINEPLYYYREESSIHYSKLIKAYSNQIDIVKDKYSHLIPFSKIIRFYIVMRIKMLVTYVLKTFNISHFLLNIRNRKTVNSDVAMNELQRKLDGFLKQ
ncbi:glycosyltransferase family 2 protein [Thalassotalea litorea]|uniref:glycosyltransferase family 2 protein n=1 Tax=Thalassotalea litorea TaxID=2020715 RepID=UPI003736569E